MDYLDNLDRYMKELGCYTAEDCIPAIHEILRDGGVASRFDGTNTIGLMHHPIHHIQQRKRIWPLPPERIHLCLYTVYAGNHASPGWVASASNNVSLETFTIQDSERYIKRFLAGAEPNYVISITRL